MRGRFRLVFFNWKPIRPTDVWLEPFRARGV
jgi:hypothetical protein